MRPQGRNPTFRRSGKRWLPLENGKRVLVRKGDAIRFADVEIQII